MEKPRARYAELGKRLGEVFAGAGEDQAATAARLEVSQSYVSRLVAGKDRPSMQLLSKINRVYELDELESLMRLARFIEDPNQAAEVDETAALAQKVDEISRKLDQVLRGYETYDVVYQRLYHEMAARLRADGYSVVPAPSSHEGGTTGLTPEDAVQEISELERVFRKRFPPDAAR